MRYLGNKLLKTVIGMLNLTLRVETSNKNKFEAALAKGNIVLAFWHGAMYYPWYANRGKGFAALVSKSKDGQLLADLLEKWKYNVVRGSSHIGGKAALDEMISLADSNYSIAITPDGPTGPYREMKAGAVVTALKTKIPIVLMAVGYKKKYVLNSWDKFEIPKPFSKVKVIYSSPVFIDESLSREETTLRIKGLERELNKLQEEAETFA